ncbi:MAG: hypothetical protein ABI193_18760 [Minicystis sp.]
MVTWPDLRLDRPKGARWPVSFGVTVAVGALGGAGCALVGYGFDGYGGVGGSTGSGGASSQDGGAGTAGAGGRETTSSTGTTGSGMPCTLPSDCDDKNECTTDLCVMGACASVPVVTNDSDPCTDDLCAPNMGVYHLPTSCNDNNPCTTDTCQKPQGCVHVLVPSRDDGDACTNDVCDPNSGADVHLPINDCCTHSVCATGVALDPSACPMPKIAMGCITSICAAIPACCNVIWSASCLAAVPSLCSMTATFNCGCAHSYCFVGTSLATACDPCVYAVCDDPDTKYCCDPGSPLGWNASCIAQTHNLCNIPLDADCK